jgi:LAO/AO transport system kinase
MARHGPNAAASRKSADEPALLRQLRAGDRRALARAITLVESARADHRETAEALLSAALPHSGGAIRLGITGVPGVGKSTFIEAFGQHVIDAGHRIAVLAIDPSSKVSGGSILGDKTRMEALARHAEAFVRPSPSGLTLGGVARRTREAMLLCEAAGFDVVLVETVGVGQAETAVADMVDMFLLLLLPGGGDELQGLKKGILEYADLVLVNKADGAFEASAGEAQATYQAALNFLRPGDGGWRPKVQLCSATTGKGVAEAWETVLEHRKIMQESGAGVARRRAQASAWLQAELQEGLLEALRAHAQAARLLPQLEAAVADGSTTPGAAARRLIAAFLGGET